MKLRNESLIHLRPVTAFLDPTDLGETLRKLAGQLILLASSGPVALSLVWVVCRLLL